VFISYTEGWPQVAHEMGHAMGTLMDEYGDGKGAYPGPAIGFGNCSSPNGNAVQWLKLLDQRASIPTAADWQLAPNRAGVFVGCRLFDSAIFSPSNDCRMGTNADSPFCVICEPLMTAMLASVTQASRPVTALRLTAQVWPDGKIQIISSRSGQQRLPGPRPRVGSTVYTLVSDGSVVAAEPIDEDPFEVRAYEGGRGAPHGSVRREFAIVQLSVPSAAIAELTRIGLTLTLSRISERAEGQVIDLPSVQRWQRTGLLQDFVTVPATAFRAAFLLATR
jgi:hypothetical protein